ncbi:hypothetical protein J437_LFUL009090 [Ladona fulva]|uniref:DUF4708 domain-containing protein n=1 Tax=Ladona fulva TaxID=123851 RepID=A0A8K0JVV8_LADFU|nr:hypothetical protein J437_LFUL009090 [Ladona fulva]
MEVFRDDARKILLLTPVPFEGELQCITCSIKPPIEPKSLFQWKVLKCRMLLFTEMRIIASPSAGFENEIWVVMSKNYYETGEIHSHLNRVGLTVEKRIQTTKSIYEACLRYTMIARIAPLWNQMASFLVCGRNFLLQREPLLAVALDVFMIGKEMSIAIWPHRIHMYGVPLQDLLEEKEEMINILPEIIVNEGRWVHVLPSLKKAQVLSVSKRIPKHCRFLSYKQLKRHWKNNVRALINL